MNELELRMNFNSFIKLKDFVKVNDISAEIREYIKKNDVVDGNLDVSGTYLKGDMEKVNKFAEVIPFSIMFKDSDFEILDIDCVNLDYHVVDGRGIEIEFDIQVKYYEENDIVEIPVIVEDENVVNLFDNDRKLEEVEPTYEELKDLKTDEIEKMIEEKITSIDNLPTEEISEELDEGIEEESEIIVNSKTNVTVNSVQKVRNNSDAFIGDFVDETRSTIKVCYYDAEKDLERVCIEKNVGIDKVFKDNKNTDFNKYRRIIIK